MTATSGSGGRRASRRITALCVLAALLLVACSDSDDVVDDAAETTASSGVDVGLFFDGAIVGDPTTEACTLSDGAETMCLRITVAGDPVTYDAGPFCPSTITDTAEAGGLWLDGEDVYDLDGAFIEGLAELYGDDNWQMFDEDGNVFVTETAEEFDLAARPDVDESVQNHCVEGRVEWLEGGEPVASTVLIPVEPVLAEAPGTTGGDLGITLDGVLIAPSAPVEAILSAYTIAAFDDCGGHYNPVDGYHLHGAVGCSELDGDADDGAPSMFAYAMDGVPVHSPDPDATDLDECGGHVSDEDGYHYHANPAEQNLVIECLIGQTVSDGTDGGAPQGPPAGNG
ncbi:MAG: hypothetical protein AAGA99_22095 [Actinomycetota bacterium]